MAAVSMCFSDTYDTDESCSEKSDTSIEDCAAPISDDDELPSNEHDDTSNKGLANVMAKILSKNLPTNKPAVLAKAKTDRQILRERHKKQEEAGEKITGGAENVVKTKETALQRETQLKKKQWENMCRVKPNILEREKERNLQRIATKGVVQLFNAVRKQQTVLQERLSEVGPSESRREKVIKSISKGDFLDLLKGTNSERLEKTSINPVKDEAPSDNATWGILRDGFMMGAKMKDWDKQEDDDMT